MTWCCHLNLQEILDFRLCTQFLMKNLHQSCWRHHDLQYFQTHSGGGHGYVVQLSIIIFAIYSLSLRNHDFIINIVWINLGINIIIAMVTMYKKFKTIAINVHYSNFPADRFSRPVFVLKWEYLWELTGLPTPKTPLSAFPTNKSVWEGGVRLGSKVRWGPYQNR